MKIKNELKVCGLPFKGKCFRFHSYGNVTCPGYDAFQVFVVKSEVGCAQSIKQVVNLIITNILISWWKSTCWRYHIARFISQECQWQGMFLRNQSLLSKIVILNTACFSAALQLRLKRYLFLLDCPLCYCALNYVTSMNPLHHSGLRKTRQDVIIVLLYITHNK